MRSLVLAFLAVATLLIGAPAAEREALTNLVRSFTQAQHDFDLATLRALTAENYVEVSPLGEVDARDKMLGFYAPDQKIAAPPVTVTDFSVRLFGDSAAVIAKITYDVPGHPMTMRGTYIAHREASGWKLVSVQCTAIRPSQR
jgi:ketosteroid isomerase-like protein